MSEIRVSEIRGSEIRVSEIRISSNHRELHGAIFAGNFITDSQVTTVLEKHPPGVYVIHNEDLEYICCPSQVCDLLAVE